MQFIIRLFLSAVAVLITAYLLPGVKVDTILDALIVAAALAFLNSIVKPVLMFFSFPLIIFSLGIFLIVINVIIIFIADKFIDGFHVRNFWWALIFSIVVSIITSILNAFTKKRENED